VERAGALLGLASDADKPPVRQYTERFYEAPETRAAALGAMWRSLDRGFGTFLLRHLEDSDAGVKQESIIGCGYLGVHEAANRLRKLFRDTDVRSDAIFAYALCVRSEISRGRVRGLLRTIEVAAGGFTESEEELVKVALDERLLLNGHKPVFYPERHAGHVSAPDEPEPMDAPPAAAAKAGRNDPCPCGSGKKYKKCCGA
jgi:hypothetical protein